jgi:hypothetical protein
MYQIRINKVNKQIHIHSFKSQRNKPTAKSGKQRKVSEKLIQREQLDRNAVLLKHSLISFF